MFEVGFNWFFSRACIGIWQYKIVFFQWFLQLILVYIKANSTCDVEYNLLLIILIYYF